MDLVWSSGQVGPSRMVHSITLYSIIPLIFLEHYAVCERSLQPDLIFWIMQTDLVWRSGQVGPPSTHGA